MDIINKIVEYFQPRDIEQPNFFDQYTKILQSFQDQISSIQTEGLENQIEVVQNELKDLHDYVKQAKVLIVFMGITSSGKSTFINSLLGQQLLPARNQTCTANVIYIQNDKEYRINNEKMVSLNQTYEKLQKIQNSAKINRVNITCPSYFHSRLPQDLRDRLIFVDTPGFNLSLNNPMTYFEHLNAIEEQIEVEKYAYRINVWISNYTTFDVDKEFQKKILPQFLQQQLEQISNNQAINFLLDLEGDASNNNLQQFSQQLEIEKHENTFIYIMNKFDERKASEDIPVGEIIQGVKEIARQDTETYKISGLSALRYNILNYGTDEAKEKFYTTFYQDYKMTYGFDSLKSAKRFCLELKDNQQLIIYQDYGKFLAQLDIQTKTLISKGFKENKIHNHIEEIKVLQSLIQCRVNYNLPAEDSQKLKDFFENTRAYLINYEQQLRQYHKSYQNQMHYIIDQAKIKLNEYNANVKQIIESICIRFIRDFENFNSYVNNETVKRMDSIMAIIQNIFHLESPNEVEIIHPSIIIVKGCKAIIDYELDNSIPKLQEQAFQDYADRLQEKLSYNYRKYQQRSAILTSGISAASLVAGRVILSQLAMIAPVALIGYGIVQIYFSQIDVDQDLAKQVLDQWAEGSQTQVSDMINNYIIIYHNAIDGVEKLLRMFDI